MRASSKRNRDAGLPLRSHAAMRRLDALDRLTARAENVGADRDQGQRALSLRPRSGAKSETSTSHHDLRVRPRLRATPRGSACVTGIQLLDTDAARRRRTRDCGEPMIDTLEKRLIEALKSVDAHGDVAPAHVHDPMTMVLRENAIQKSNALGRCPRRLRIDGCGSAKDCHSRSVFRRGPRLQEARCRQDPRSRIVGRLIRKER